MASSTRNVHDLSTLAGLALDGVDDADDDDDDADDDDEVQPPDEQFPLL